MADIHVADVGTVFEVTIKEGAEAIDVSGCTSKKIGFLKPSLVTLEKTADFTTDGTDGKIRIVFDSDDLDEEGKWKWQAQIIWASGTWHTSEGSFRVKPNILIFAA